MVLTQLEAYSKMVSSKGTVFTVEFIKKDGSLRKMNCRLGVKKYLKGGKLAYNPIAKLLLTVFDMQKKDYRCVNLKTVKSLSIDKKHYEVIA